MRRAPGRQRADAEVACDRKPHSAGSPSRAEAAAGEQAGDDQGTYLQAARGAEGGTPAGNRALPVSLT
jgi:hypothetical protein